MLTSVFSGLDYKSTSAQLVLHYMYFEAKVQMKEALFDPDEIRKSKKDPDVYLFYHGSKPRWICAVARKQNEAGFLITAYHTDSIKAGDSIWKKSK